MVPRCHDLVGRAARSGWPTMRGVSVTEGQTQCTRTCRSKREAGTRQRRVKGHVSMSR